MNHRAVFALVVATVVAGGCTSSDGIPATAPSTTSPVPATSTTGTAPAGTTSTTTDLAPAGTGTTTVDREAEVTAIFQDLEQRRLEAIYTGDVEAFTALFADTPYLDRSLEVFELVESGEVPTIEIEVLEILRDDPECLALYYRAVDIATGEVSEGSTVTLVPSAGMMKYAFTNSGKGGWLCDGPHPLSS